MDSKKAWRLIWRNKILSMSWDSCRLVGAQTNQFLKLLLSFFHFPLESPLQETGSPTQFERSVLYYTPIKIIVIFTRYVLRAVALKMAADIRRMQQDKKRECA